jgi:hypothetical protein
MSVRLSYKGEPRKKGLCPTVCVGRVCVEGHGHSRSRGVKGLCRGVGHSRSRSAWIALAVGA